LLGVKPAVLRGYLRSRAVEFAEDETNADLRIRRNAVRAMLADMERLVPGATRNVARTIVLLRGDRSLLEALTVRAWRWCRVRGGGQHALETKKLRTLPQSLARRVVRHAVKAADAEARDFSFAQCDAIVDAVRRKHGGRFQAGSAEIELSAGMLRISPHDRRTTQDPGRISKRSRHFPATGRVRTPFGALTFLKIAKPAPHGDTVQLLDASTVGRPRLHVRNPQPGDKCVPSGRHSPLPLARFLAKAGVPKSLRGTVPLLCAENRIVAALGLRVMEPFAAKTGQPLVYMHWHPAEMPIMTYTDRSEPSAR
jgi:tRNA(Ile)-lysidine synthetase-like protein